MGGRGASSGMSVKGEKYGTEYTTLFQSGEIKFVRYNDSIAAKTPMETMSKGRIYVIVDSTGRLKAITRYDQNNKRYMQIDLSGVPHKIDGKSELPHTHLGYLHDENGTFKPSAEDQKLIDRVYRLWNNRGGGE